MKKLLRIVFGLGLRSLWLPATVAGIWKGYIHVDDVTAAIPLLILFVFYIGVQYVLVHIPLTDKDGKGHQILSVAVGLDVLCIGMGFIMCCLAGMLLPDFISSTITLAVIGALGVTLSFIGIFSFVKEGPIPYCLRPLFAV